MRDTTWGDIASLVYGKALSGYGKDNKGHGGRARVFGTNGPIGWHSESMHPGDRVVVGRKGAYRGVHLASGPFWVIDTAYYLDHDESIDSRWAYYSLRNTDINGLGSGSAIPSTTRPDFYALPVRVPPLNEQRAIAEVLGALDDKIAANADLTTTSLELADAIFQRTADGLAFGSTTFEDVASIQGGGTPSTKVEEYWGGEVLWATPTDVTNLGAPYLERTARTITQAGFEACSSALHPVGSILMTSRATIGAFAIAQASAAVNQGFIVVNAHDPSLQWWLFHEMRSRVLEFLSHANGATFLELSRGRFKKLPVRCPDDAVTFQAEVSPIHRRARAAAVESERLGKTRDLLLPLLMSGKIRVKDAERVVEGVV